MTDQFNRPRKALGQNFLQDHNIIDKIGGAVGAREDEYVVEIGPGRGALTEELLATGCHLTLIEFDRDLVEYWQQRARETNRNRVGSGKITVIGEDVLKVDFTALLNENSKAKLKIVGNLPYNISSPILLHLLNYSDMIASITIMLQKEVITRLCAAHGNKDYGRLSVVMQQAFHINHLFNVSASAFYPPPKVTSAVAQLLPHKELPVADPEVLKSLVKQAFSQRRKTLKNNFKKSPYLPLLQACDIDERRRAETVSVQEYVKMANMLISEVS